MTWAASIGGGFANGSARLVFGYLIDIHSFKTLFGWLTLMALINAVLMYWTAWYAPAYFICIMINYIYLGGIFTIFPPAV